MTMTSRIAGLGMTLGLALCGVACGTQPEPVTKGLPPLTAEEQVVVDNMAKGTLAEIDLPDGKMRFIEIEPGQVIITRLFRMGADVPQLKDEGSMTPDQVFHAYAPDREIPRPLMDAVARTAARHVEETAAPRLAATPGVEAIVRPIASKITPSADGVERTTSALASGVDANWFTGRFCNVTNADFTTCQGAVGTGYWATMYSHRTNAVICGDTGSVRANFKVNGGVKAVFDVGYTQCFVLIPPYHGAHGWFGINLEANLLHEITFAQQTARVATWFATEDQFIGNGW
jgi:hypothetical protein